MLEGLNQKFENMSGDLYDQKVMMRQQSLSKIGNSRLDISSKKPYTGDESKRRSTMRDQPLDLDAIKELMKEVELSNLSDDKSISQIEGSYEEEKKEKK
mmetsp:Transcript_10296/g.9094  ORF Transcript_10296/g.9094 Transcript_10296/m.9094 type:complete len:99 (-) Transcript_10296:63-359(-)